MDKPKIPEVRFGNFVFHGQIFERKSSKENLISNVKTNPKEGKEIPKSDERTGSVRASTIQNLRGHVRVLDAATINKHYDSQDRYMEKRCDPFIDYSRRSDVSIFSFKIVL